LLDSLGFERFMALTWDIEMWHGAGLGVNLGSTLDIHTVKVPGTLDAARDFAELLAEAGHGELLVSLDEPLGRILLRAGGSPRPSPEKR